ncbi:MAG TPA: Na/Pi cotransporter family protein [bacterium]|nr:Na/Pi cotransporter family protein [bacterium]
MSENLTLFNLFGGVFILLYGIKLAGDGLQGWAGERIKTALETMTKNRFASLFTGVVITFLLQSSSATTVTMVSLIDSGLISFSQTLGVILGADIGTTITVQLISFKIYDLALLICGVGLALMFITKDQQRKHLGQAILGFGLIFLAIKVMLEAMSPLKDSALFQEILKASGSYPLTGILFSALLTALIHSSAATIGIAITLSMSGLIGIDAAIPIVLGANIGTCATALMASFRSSVDAKRAATANVLFKVIGTLLILPFLGPFADLVRLTAAETARQIANAHTIFNIALALLLLPFTGVFARLIEKWFPEKEAASDEFKPKYLNPAMLKTPALALAQATREALRMAEIVQDMLKMSLPALMECNLELIEKVENMDDRVDLLDRGIRFYLTQLGKEQLGHEGANHQMEILAAISNLESIGDVVDKNLMELARKKARKCVHFSAEGHKDIVDLHARVMENLELAMSAFTTRDRDIAERVLRNKARIRDLEREYYRRHIERLESGLSESFETSSIHLDVLTNLKRINTHLTSILYPLLDNKPSQ